MLGAVSEDLRVSSTSSSMVSLMDRRYTSRVAFSGAVNVISFTVETAP